MLKMDCNLYTVERSFFKVGEVYDVSRCLDCGFEFYEVYRKQGKWKRWYESAGVSERYTNDMESPRQEMGQTIERYAEDMKHLRKKTEYRLPSYSSTSMVYRCIALRKFTASILGSLDNIISFVSF
ncbi:hypothetical protein [Nitrososphaera sp. AFS]|uniref:hypothetical protein n=1 Tax=Nitrososphaera sp. AFS TaxID=2301191 RepID=UPI001392414C|nr:hypothetical protein [Nitrososphaera sp. AFS]NAL78040.1 hypothetical protein [Nitrososphaera sp. AFS]